LWRSKNPRLFAVQARLSQTMRQPLSANLCAEAFFNTLLSRQTILRMRYVFAIMVCHCGRRPALGEKKR